MLKTLRKWIAWLLAWLRSFFQSEPIQGDSVMPSLSIQPTFPIFTDIDGQPLEDGFVWIGQANLDPQGNPINVYWDSALTQPAGQPIRTLGGYPSNSGTPARLYVNSDYSIRVMNKNGSVVYGAPEATERYGNIINATNVVYDPPGIGASQTDVASALDPFINVLNYGADPTGAADSTSAFQAAYNQALLSGMGVYVPNGTYKILDSSAFPSQVNGNPAVNIWAGQDVRYIGNVVLGNYYSIPTFGASRVNAYNLNSFTYLYAAPNEAIEDPGAPGQYPFGSAPLSVDCIPGTSFRGNGNAAFFEIIGVNGANFALGGINIVSAMRSGFLGNANCMELDLENSAADGKGLGIVLTGQGTFKPEVAHKVLRFPYLNQSPTGAGGNWIPPWQFGIQIYNAEVGLYIDQSQVQTPSTALYIKPGPQAVPTNKAIIVEDQNSSSIFAVQNDGYIDYRGAAQITSFGANAVGLSAPQIPIAYLMSDKTVRLAGQITATTGNTIIGGATLATLAAEFRPNRTVILPAVTSNGLSIWLQISSAGVITCNTNITDAYAATLDSISYLKDN